MTPLENHKAKKRFNIKNCNEFIENLTNLDKDPKEMM